MSACCSMQLLQILAKPNFQTELLKLEFRFQKYFIFNFSDRKVPNKTVNLDKNSLRSVNDRYVLKNLPL